VAFEGQRKINHLPWSTPARILPSLGQVLLADRHTEEQAADHSLRLVRKALSSLATPKSLAGLRECSLEGDAVEFSIGPYLPTASAQPVKSDVAQPGVKCCLA